ncbi:MAG: NAD(P)/FAD-dependent oxidoreductase [Ostreibacterium sp.]
MAKKATELSGVLDTTFYNSPHAEIKAPYGVGRVHFAGKIDIKTLLFSYRHYLEKQEKYYTEAIDYKNLTLTKEGAIYASERGDIQAKKVVCCEGYGVKQNPYFCNLPLKGNKGETLTARLTNLTLTSVIKSTVFIMPMPELGNDIYFIGATYHWTDKVENPSETAKSYLLDKITRFFTGDIEVLSHCAGIRPTVIDRQPLLGRHKNYPNLYILNGLGTRGVMLGATMAQHLYRFTEYGNALLPKVDISRFSR